MFERNKIEKNFSRLFEIYGLGSTVWSPLCCGILTGKYNDGSVPECSRFDVLKEDQDLREFWMQFFSEEKK
jgi:aryl-alcohol dehydrogenase-like predicted oxidoreductase